MQIMMHRIFPGHVYLVNVILLFGISMPLLSFGNIIGKIVFCNGNCLQSLVQVM